MPTPRTGIPRAAVAAIRDARAAAESAAAIARQMVDGTIRDIPMAAADIVRLLLEVTQQLSIAESTSMRPRRPRVGQPVTYRDADGRLHAATIVAVVGERVQLLVTFIHGNQPRQEVRDAGPDEWSWPDD